MRNHEVLRANNRDLSGYNGDFLCAKGRFGFDFTRHPDRLRQPLVRRNGTLATAQLWEDALEEVASRLAAIRKESGSDAIGFYGSNRTTNEENYLFGRIARGAIGTNNIDHHRTADYAGLIAMVAGLAKNAKTPAGNKLSPETPLEASTETSERLSRGGSVTMGELASAPAFFLIGNDASEQNPLVAWQIRTAIRHVNARLYVVDSHENRNCCGKQSYTCTCNPGQEVAALAALALTDAASQSSTGSAIQRSRH